MRYLMFLMCLLPVVANAECYLQTEASSTASGIIDEVSNVKVTIIDRKNGEKTCTVVFTALIDRKLYDGSGIRTYDNSTTTDGNACAEAVADGKAELIGLVSRATISADSTLRCNDDPNNNPIPVAQHLTVGQVVADGALQQNPDRDRFIYKGANCMYYMNTEVNKKDLYQYQGVACQLINDTRWIIVDKY